MGVPMRPSPHRVADRPVSRGVAQVVIGAHLHPRRRARLDHAARVGQGQRQRLLAQHVLAGRGRSQGVLQVGFVRGADVDDVDGGVGEQSVNGVIGSADVVLARIGRATFRAVAHYRDDVAVALGANRADHPFRRDGAGADESPAEGIGHRLGLSFGTGPQVPRTTSEGARISSSAASLGSAMRRSSAAAERRPSSCG